MDRGELIGQLRHALTLAESPAEEMVEFEICDTGFSLDFTEDDHKESQPRR